MLKEKKCVSVFAHQLGEDGLSEAYEIDLGVDLPDLRADTIIVQALDEEGDNHLLGLIWPNGLYTPVNLLGTIRYVQKFQGAMIDQRVTSRLELARAGLHSNLRNQFYFRAHQNTDLLALE